MVWNMKFKKMYVKKIKNKINFQVFKLPISNYIKKILFSKRLGLLEAMSFRVQ